MARLDVRLDEGTGSAMADHDASVETRSHKWQIERTLSRIFLYMALVIGTIIFTVPLIWMVSSSFKPEGQVFQYPPKLIPSQFQPWNYTDALAQFPFLAAFKNTMTVVIGVGIGRLLSASLTAFVFARMRFPFRNALFVLVLATMMVPYHAVLLPQYLFFRNLGWLDSLRPLIVPQFFAVSAFYVFLLRQFFMTIPRDYDDAARIDGCGFLGTFWRIILPMSKPALGTVMIFTFMEQWNDFLAPLIYLNSKENLTLAVAIKQWQHQATALFYHPAQWNHIMAMATLISIPPILIFFFTQRYFVQGVVVSGIKG
jgi:ABC-type glycerol-3-phosphate transport system permease component